MQPLPTASGSPAMEVMHKASGAEIQLRNGTKGTEIRITKKHPTQESGRAMENRSMSALGFQ